MISILVPAFNEERHLAGAIKSVREAAQQAGNIGIEIIVINDGSTDRTREVSDALARRYSEITCLHKERNEGLAAAVKDALSRARYPKFISVPGSNDMQLEHLAALFRCHDQADLVCSYYVNREVRGRIRTAVSALFGIIYMATFNVFVQYITGPVLYPTALLRTLHLHSQGFSIFAEMTVKALLSGCSYTEVAGYMSAVQKRSSTVSVRNMSEVLTTYCILLWEIKLTKRDAFSHQPKRIYPVVLGQSLPPVPAAGRSPAAALTGKECIG